MKKIISIGLLAICLIISAPAAAAQSSNPGLARALYSHVSNNKFKILLGLGWSCLHYMRRPPYNWYRVKIKNTDSIDDIYRRERSFRRRGAFVIQNDALLAGMALTAGAYGVEYAAKKVPSFARGFVAGVGCAGMYDLFKNELKHWKLMH